MTKGARRPDRGDGSDVLLGDERSEIARDILTTQRFGRPGEAMVPAFPVPR